MFYNHLRQLAGQWDESSPSFCPQCQPHPPCPLHGQRCEGVFWREWKKKQDNIWFPIEAKDSAQQLLDLYSTLSHNDAIT